MKTKLIILIVAPVFGAIMAIAAPMGTAFTYQGVATDNGLPATGLYDVQCLLYDAPTNGVQVGPTLNLPGCTTDNNGVFTVPLDFGAGAFNGQARWLEWRVRTNGSSASYTVLFPRQELTPAPSSLFALNALNAATLGGQTPGAFAPASGSTTYLTKSGDTMTGFLHLPYDGLTAGGNQLVLSAGNVGIGTVSPQAKLHVAGSIMADELNLGYGGYAYSSSFVLGNDGAGNLELGNSLGNSGIPYIDFHYGVGADQDYNVRLINDINGRLKCVGNFMVSGNVGIGEGSPTDSLVVGGGGNLVLKAAADDAGDIIFRTATGTQKGRIFTEPSAGQNKLYLSSGDNQADITIDAGGNVGIGTASPAKALEVRREILIKGNDDGGREYSDWPYPSLSIRRSDNNAANCVTMLSLGYRNDPLYKTDDSVANIRLWDPIQSLNAENSTSYTQLRIASPGPLVLQPNGGTVDIGLGNPQSSALYVNGDINATGYITGKTVEVSAISDYYPYATMWMDSGGASQMYLAVGDNYDWYNFIFRSDGQFSCRELHETSDARFKRNIAPLSDALDLVTKLRGVSFEWDDSRNPQQGSPAGRQLGLIAQEVEQVVPEVVHQDKEGIRSISYTKLVPVLVEAVKEQRQRTEQIAAEKETEIQTLKQELTELKALVNTMLDQKQGNVK